MIRFLNAHFPSRTVFLGLSEACLVTVAFITAMVLRLGPGDASVTLSFEQGFLKIGVISFVFVTCMYYFDLYASPILCNRREFFTRFVQVSGTTCILLAVLYYVYPPLELGRGIFVIGFSLVIAMLFLWRRLFLMMNSLPQFTKRTVILGDGSIADSLAREFRNRPELGARVVGQLASVEAPNGHQPMAGGQVNALRSFKADRIVVAFHERRGKLPVEALLQMKAGGVQIQDGTALYEAITGKVHIETLRESWLLFSSGFRLSRPLLIYKRAASLILSAIGLVLTFPLAMLAAIAIRLDSEGPAIFRQRRVGYGGEVFTVYKFRTMINRADDNDNHQPAEISDSRFTRVGRWLRRTRIDELPQLVNILRGDMHFVGPRPFVINQEQECVEKIPFYRQRWAVKPGATGWAQVNRGYNVTIDDNREKLAYDLFYIKNMSVGLDLLVLLKTVKILLLGRGSR